MHVDAVGSWLPFVEISGIPFKLPFPEKTLKLETERIFEKSFKQISFETEGKTARVGFKAQCPLKVDFYKISVPKKGEIICGDSVTAFCDDDGFFYSIISDGMGKGHKAASESNLVIKTILDLLKYNVPVEEAMRLMNSIMVIKNDIDLYATLDLAVIDKKTGKAVFYKIGAAPSLIKKQNRIE